MTKNYRPKSWYIQLIHIAKNQLKMDDDLYRENLKNSVKKTSCADMSLSELVQVLEHFKKLGFKPKATKKLSPKSSDKPGEKTMLDKLRQVWIVMHKQGFINDGSEQALENWAIGQSKRFNKGVPVQKLEWTNNQMRYALVEQLKKWHVRLLKEVVPALFNEVKPHITHLDTALFEEAKYVTKRLNSAPETHATLCNAFDCYTNIINEYNKGKIK